MKNMRRLFAVLLMGTLALASCDAQVTESSLSSSSSSGSASQVVYRNITDLKATADLAKVAFFSGSRQLVVDDGTGEKVAYTTESFSLDGIQWSPDGRYVSFYRRGNDGMRKLLVYDSVTEKTAEGSGQGEGGFDIFGRGNLWSPDSTKVLNYRVMSGGYYDIKEGKTVDIESEKGFYAASFSPDGSRILYCQADRQLGAYVLRTYDVATGNSVKVYQYEIFNPVTGTSPMWLSESEILVFEDSNDMLYRVEVATGKKKEYLSDIYAGFALSPDRKYIAYSKANDLNLLWIKEIATGTQTEVKTESTRVIPVWSYDSNKVILCGGDGIRVFGLDGVQIGETVKVALWGSSSTQWSIPVYTKNGLWYEGKDEV